ncbi:sporulation related protein [Lutibacter sp. Hel_I_33_5]|uniref:HU domain-containing protein n=1 Tax=Lutibacter sp. Hel_I_33_5 TaxID=1566289 RepID=UPI0011A348FE|nr:SPOR domain-containing protein [Lutibacter sp. Hel_I_33_5]TVZ56166.1 sporulation related protein [Lutibacter sp. Hel_I_33_5]
MTLANYINDLLYRHECVIIPNFGGFVTNKISAQLHKNKQQFYPPTKQISFNSHLKHNDGLLANYIAEVENISFDDALNSISKTITSWEQKLVSETVEIDSVGTLSLNDKKQLIFEPNTTINYLTDSFGLAAVNSSAVTRFKEKVIPIIPVEKEERKRVPAFIKYAATAAILLTVGTLGWKGYQNDLQQKQHLAKEEAALEKKIQSATFVISNPLPTINLNVSKEQPKSFHIIAGAFQFPENATKKLKQLKAKGYKASIIGKNKWGLTQVAFSSYSTRSEATNNLYRIQDTISEDAWLLIKKAM